MFVIDPKRCDRARRRGPAVAGCRGNGIERHWRANARLEGPARLSERTRPTISRRRWTWRSGRVRSTGLSGHQRHRARRSGSRKVDTAAFFKIPKDEDERHADRRPNLDHERDQPDADRRRLRGRQRRIGGDRSGTGLPHRLGEPRRRNCADTEASIRLAASFRRGQDRGVDSAKSAVERQRAAAAAIPQRCARGRTADFDVVQHRW